MKKYKDYQTVSSLWVDSLPIHWEFNKLRSIFWQRKEKNDPVKTKEILSLSAKAGVELYSQKAHGGGNKAKDDITKYNIAHEGDLIVNCMNVISGSVGLSKYYGAISPVYYALVTRNEKFNRDYYHYVFKIEPFQKSLLPLGRGILMHESSTGKLNTIRMRISMSDFNNVNLPVPPRDEQDQIVRYLDWQISRINHLIHGYQKQIKLLEERKFTILDQLVHNGILASEFNEYDIEYIGKVPAHWHVLQNHRIFESAKRKFEGMPTVLSLSQKDGLIPYSELNERTLHTASYDNWQLVHENDLVLNRFKAHLGVFFASKYTGIVTFHYGVYKPKMPLLSKYYETLYHTQVYKRVYAGQSKGMTIGLQNLSDTDFYSVYTLYPPYDEQVAIVREIESVEEKFLKIRAGIMKQIELLKEYRTRLISDVVTGQIDVRDVVIPEYTPEEDTEIDTDDIGEGAEEVAENAE